MNKTKSRILLLILSFMLLTMPSVAAAAYDVTTQPVSNAAATYKSPDGLWETPMYYMDATVNGTRKLWPMKANLWYTDVWVDGHDNETISITYDADQYNPYSFSSGGAPYFALSIEEGAVPGVTYTQKNFGFMGFEMQGYEVIDLTNCGAFNLTADPHFIIMSTGSSVCSYAKDTREGFVEAVLRIDTLDRENGIVAGYLKFSMLNKYDEKMDVEGYFADKFKNDSDRPTKGMIYDQLHPKAPGSENTNTPAVNTIPSNTNIKMPSLINSPCPECYGTGKITCSSCYGVGYSSHMGYKYGVYGVIVDPCMMCGGAGGRLCYKCGGSGTITQFVTP